MAEGWGGGAARRMASALLGAAMLLLGGTARLQAQEDEAGQTAFAGGQMVRGTVAAVGADGLMVKTETGETVKVVVTPNTRMMKARQPVKLAEIKPGDGVGAMGVTDAPTKTVHAAMLFVMDAEQVRKAREDLGKTYITGRVTAIDEVKLTIKRPDGVSQVIRVDEDTSFKRGRRGAGGGGAGMGQGAGSNGVTSAGAESITLADVKVGDMVFGKGGLKDGVFVPTELGVMDGAGRGRRVRGSAATGGSPNAEGTPR